MDIFLQNILKSLTKLPEFIHNKEFCWTLLLIFFYFLSFAYNFRHWSLKESYVKAIGIGITINLQELNFKIKTKTLQEDQITDDTELFVKGEKLKWNFHEILLDSDHCVSVAIENQPADKMSFRSISFEELMQDCVPLITYDESFVNQYFSKLDK